jgi:hypothetical protein
MAPQGVKNILLKDFIYYPTLFLHKQKAAAPKEKSFKSIKQDDGEFYRVIFCSNHEFVARVRVCKGLS